MGAKILQFYEKCKSCPKLFASKGKKAFKLRPDAAVATSRRVWRCVWT